MLKYLRKYWYFGALAVIFMIIEVSVDMLQPKLMARIVDDGILGLSGNGQPDLQLISTTGIIMILVVLAGGLSGILSGTMANMCSQKFGNDVRKKCFERIMNLSFEQTDAFTTGSLITRITNDVSQLERLVQSSVRGFVRCLMFMVVGTITLLSLNQHFLVIIACAFPLVLIDIIFILWKTNPLFMKLQMRIDNMNTVIRENINGARVVKAFIQEDRENQRFDKANQALVKMQLRILILMSYLRPVMNIILNLATVALIWIGAIHVRKGGMLPGEVMAAVTYISQILNGMMMLAMIFQTLSRGTASYKRLKEVLDTEPVIRSGEDAETSDVPDDNYASASDAPGAYGSAASPAPGENETSAGNAGITIDNCSGEDTYKDPDKSGDPEKGCRIEFRNVSFAYPKQPGSDADPGGTSGNMTVSEESDDEEKTSTSTSKPNDAPVAIDAVSGAAPIAKPASGITASSSVAASSGTSASQVAADASGNEASSGNAGPLACTSADTPDPASATDQDQSQLDTSMSGEGAVLTNIDLTIDAGETLAVVGATGCGKTTLVNLIPRFYDVDSGCVLIDGKDVRTFDLTELRRMIAFVTQKNELFSTTIKENILLGDPDADDEAVRSAARMAQAESFILEQPEGYDTPVAEGGMSLSGGQRQRIAIARALLKNARILIMDDSTSALDLRTESDLYDALNSNCSGSTRIVIAQRIATARRADRIAVLDNGEIIACGTHDELMETCSVYQDICASQIRSK